jgi:hypothetical protein
VAPEGNKVLYGTEIFWSSTEARYPQLLVLDPSIRLHAASADELLRVLSASSATLLSTRNMGVAACRCSSLTR